MLRLALLFASFLFLPAAGVAWMLPDLPDERTKKTEDELCY